jgi:hypothetical protein
VIPIPFPVEDPKVIVFPKIVSVPFWRASGGRTYICGTIYTYASCQAKSDRTKLSDPDYPVLLLPGLGFGIKLPAAAGSDISREAYKPEITDVLKARMYGSMDVSEEDKALLSLDEVELFPDAPSDSPLPTRAVVAGLESYTELDPRAQRWYDEDVTPLTIEDDTDGLRLVSKQSSPWFKICARRVLQSLHNGVSIPAAESWKTPKVAMLQWIKQALVGKPEDVKKKSFIVESVIGRTEASADVSTLRAVLNGLSMGVDGKFRPSVLSGSQLSVYDFREGWNVRLQVEVGGIPRKDAAFAFYPVYNTVYGQLYSDADDATWKDPRVGKYYPKVYTGSFFEVSTTVEKLSKDLLTCFRIVSFLAFNTLPDEDEPIQQICALALAYLQWAAQFGIVVTLD